MVKAFILVLIYASNATTTEIHHIDFASRQSCEAAKVSFAAKAKQPGQMVDGKPEDLLKLIDSTCMEK